MCEWCRDEDIGDMVVIEHAECPFLQNAKAYLDMALCRTDRWAAKLSAGVTVRGRQEPVLIAGRVINYCPMCGRRLSLADAGRKEQKEE